jgi:hypothetical protein
LILPLLIFPKQFSNLPRELSQIAATSRSGKTLPVTYINFCLKMKIARTFPNIFWITINLSVLFFFVALVISMIVAISKNGQFLIVLPALFILTFSILFYYQFSNHFSYVILNENEIQIYQPLRFKHICLTFKEIDGYSTSEVSFGKNLFSSKSFILYPKFGNEIEIIKIFNFNFNEVLKSLDKTNILKYGPEPYKTGILKRKYKFRK